MTGSFEVPISCEGAKISGCAVSVTVKAKAGRSARAHWVAVASAQQTLLGGEQSKLTIALNRAGRQLLAERHRLTVRYSVTSIPEALTGTIVVHVDAVGGPPPPLGCSGTKCPVEGGTIYLVRVGSGERRGPRGEILSSIETHEHTLRVAPGEYEVGATSFEKQRVTVGAGQTIEVTADLLVP